MKTPIAFLLGPLTLLVACGSLVPAATPITGADGAWSNPVTWGGKLPDQNSSVTIPVGKTVTPDVSVAVRNITVKCARLEGRKRNPSRHQQRQSARGCSTCVSTASSDDL